MGEMENMQESMQDIKIKITKHTINRIRERSTVKRKDIEELLKSLFLSKNIHLHEEKNRDSFIYYLPSENYAVPPVIIFTRMEDNLFLSRTSYRTYSSKNTVCKDFYVSEVHLPKYQKTPVQLLEEEVERLFTKRNNIGQHIIHLQMKVQELDNQICELQEQINHEIHLDKLSDNSAKVIGKIAEESK